MARSRLVITGTGVLSPFGGDFWNKILKGESCLKTIGCFDASKYKSKIAGTIADFKIEDYVKNPRLSRIPRLSQMTVAAAYLALSDGCLALKEIKGEAAGIFFGTSNGPSYSTERIYDSIIERGYKAVDPLLFQETVFNAPVSTLSILLGIKGPGIALPMGLGSGGFAISSALNSLVSGRIEVALIGASDEHAEIVHEAFVNLRVLSPNDNGTEISRPFDRDRNGMVVSEGSAFLVVERLENALKRNAPIYAEVAGEAMASDAYRLADNDPGGEGLCRSMKIALEKACLDPAEVGVIFSFAPSLQNLDLMEVRAIKKAFGKNCGYPRIANIKGALGETMGPAALFNVVCALFAFKDNRIPPILNCVNPDPEAEGLNLVLGDKFEIQPDVILINYYSWGGIYGSLVLKRYRP